MMEAEGMILAGGKSSRMGGIHKGSLRWGNATFTEILTRELKKEVGTVWLSCGREIKEPATGCRPVQDIYIGCGPIGGLHAGLTVCGGDTLLVAACDMPFLKAELFSYLYGELSRQEKVMNGRPIKDGAVPAAYGKIHPLAAIYRKKAAGIFEEQIKAGNYRLRDALKRLDILYVDVTEKKEFARMLKNINTPGDYEQAVKKSEESEGSREGAD